MVRVSETRVASKGEDPKKAPKASKIARKVPPPHEEVQKISSDSSDSDSNSGAGSSSESDAAKRKSTKRPNVKKAKATEPNSPPISDNSSEEDSSSEGESGVMAKLKLAKADRKTAPAVLNTNGAVAKPKAKALAKSTEKVESSSSEESSDEEEVTAKPATNGAAREEEDDSSSDESMPDAPAATPAPKPAKAPAPVDPTKAIPASPFVPPAGYKSLPISSSSAKTLSSLLANPSEKQIWHITAPSSVFLSQLKTVSLAAIQKQISVLSHNGTDYTLAEEKESKTTKKLLVPSEKGYSAVEVPVSRSLVLQQVISLPNLNGDANPAARKGRTPRPQPKGLRMRYKPFGFGAGDPGAILGSDESEDDNVQMTEPIAFRPPPGSAQAQKEKEKEKKRKRDEKSAEEGASSPRTEKKRRKEERAAKKNAVVVDDDGVEITPGQEDAVMRIEEKAVEGTEKVGPQTEEEKARKKAEKKEKRKKDKQKS